MGNDTGKIKKPIFKRWWFWAIIVVIVLAAIGSQVGEDPVDGSNSPAVSESPVPEKVEVDSPTTNENSEVDSEIKSTFSTFCDTSYISVSPRGDRTTVSIYDPTVVLPIQDAKSSGVAPDNWEEIKSSLVELSGTGPLLQGTTQEVIYLMAAEAGEIYLTIADGSVLFDVFEDVDLDSQPHEMTLGEKNALEKAADYLEFTSFSYTGLIDQLEYEGFTTDEATFAADNCGADWNEQAALKAQSYLDFTSFSRQGLIDQLLYEGFTQAQAEYGVSSVGY